MKLLDTALIRLQRSVELFGEWLNKIIIGKRCREIERRALQTNNAAHKRSAAAILDERMEELPPDSLSAFILRSMACQLRRQADRLDEKKP